MNVWTDVPCLAAAATALCRAWFQGGGWVAACRERALAMKHFPAGPGRPWRSRLKHNLGHALSCPLCAATQACLWLAFLFYAPAILLQEPWATFARLPVYALAAAALVPLWYVRGDEPSKEVLPDARTTTGGGAPEEAGVVGPGHDAGRARRLGDGLRQGK